VTTALYAAFKKDKSAQVRRTAAWAAGNIGDESAVPGLIGLLNHPDANIRDVAAWSIGNCSPDRAPDALVRLLRDEEPGVRLSAAWALREIADPKAAEALEDAFGREKHPEVRLGIIRALGSMGEHAVETLSRLVDSPDPEIRKVAVTALAGGNATGPWPWPRPEPRPFP
jgi:HEAT repeat protein